MSRVIAAFSQFFDGSGDPLANGWLRFLETGTNNTNKNTYADELLTIPNANPLQLDAEGRCPNVFGQGVYRVDLYTNNPVTGLPGTLVQSFDPVLAEYAQAGAGSNFAEWDVGVVYDVYQIVIYNGKYYRSITSGNIGNVPTSYPDQWEEIAFLRYWNTNVTYLIDDVVVSGSALYFSLASANLGNDPSISPTWWSPVGSGTVLSNWQESGTTFQPTTAGYDLGSAVNYIGTAYITDFGIFPLTPSSDPINDYDVANKLYVDTGVLARMRWMGEWSPGTYEIYDVVRDDNWTMIANAQTDERPAPQPADDPAWVRDLFSPPDLFVGSATESVLYVGQRYTFSPSFIVRSVRAYVPSTSVGFNIEIWAVYNPATNPRYVSIYPGSIVNSSQVDRWVELPVGSLYIEDGTTVDLIMVLRSPEQELDFTYEWEYSKTNGDPPAGYIYHQGGSSADQIRVHEQDSSLVDRTSSLDLIGPGSRIYMDTTSVEWEVLDASKTGDIYTFTVDPGARSENGVSDFTFYYYGSAAIGYVYNTNLYASDARIQGYFGNIYDPDNATYIDENGYGVDIQVQNVISSADWDVVAQPQIGGSSSAGYSEVNGPMAGFRNKIVNPFFEIWQRYTGSAFTSGGYTADRKTVDSALVGVTISVDRVSGTTIDGRIKTKYGLSYAFTDDGTADSYATIAEYIEGVESIYGDVTVSIVANIPSGNSCSVELRQYHGTGGSPSASVVYKVSEDLVGTGNIETYIRRVTLDTPGTIGTNDDDSLQLFVWLTAGSDFTTYTDLGNQPDGTVIFYGWQLEPGTESTPFEQRHIDVEYSMCYRYYQWINSTNFNGFTGQFGASATTVRSPGFGNGLLGQMRVNPTITQSGTVSCIHTATNTGTATLPGSYVPGTIAWNYTNISGSPSANLPVNMFLQSTNYIYLNSEL